MAASGRGRNTSLAITALCSVQFVDVLGVTVVVTALPTMLADLNAPASAGSLVSGGYAMFFGGLLMLGARLGDRFGHRRTITASLAVLAAGALLGAVAGSVVLLTAARCLQGAAAAASVPSALRLLTTLTPAGPPRRRAIAAWSAAGASAGASGFVVGGVITDLASWRLVFWAYLPLAAALAAAVMRAVPHDRGPSHSGSLNTLAAAVFTAAVMAVVVGTTVIARPGQRAAGAVIVLLAAPLTALFVRADRRAAAPLLPAAALRMPPLRRGAAGSFLNTAATSSAMTLATLYLQDTLHRSPLQAAAMLVPFSLAVVAGSALAAPALRRIGPQPALATGLAVIAAADAALTVAAAHPAGPCQPARPRLEPDSACPPSPRPPWAPPSPRRCAGQHQGSSTRPPSSAPLPASPPCCSSRPSPPAHPDPAQAHRSSPGPPPRAIAAAGALAFTRSPQPDPAITGPTGPKADTNPAAENTPANAPR